MGKHAYTKLCSATSVCCCEGWSQSNPIKKSFSPSRQCREYFDKFFIFSNFRISCMWPKFSVLVMLFLVYHATFILMRLLLELTDFITNCTNMLWVLQCTLFYSSFYSTSGYCAFTMFQALGLGDRVGTEVNKGFALRALLVEH